MKDEDAKARMFLAHPLPPASGGHAKGKTERGSM